LFDPALEVRASSLLSNGIEFRHLAITCSDEIAKVFPEQFSVVLFSSCLVFMSQDRAARRKLITSLMQQSLCILGVERSSPELREDLVAQGISLRLTDNMIIFVWRAPILKSFSHS
jgi:hypothetical protein